MSREDSNQRNIKAKTEIHVLNVSPNPRVVKREEWAPSFTCLPKIWLFDMAKRQWKPL